jgi:hypothetical protein
MKFEYCEINVPYRGGATPDSYTVVRNDKYDRQTGEYSEILSKLGAEGWEMVSATSITLKETI